MSLDEQIKIVQLESELAALTDQVRRLQEAVNDIKDKLEAKP